MGIGSWLRYKETTVALFPLPKYSLVSSKLAFYICVVISWSYSSQYHPKQDNSSWRDGGGSTCLRSFCSHVAMLRTDCEGFLLADTCMVHIRWPEDPTRAIRNHFIPFSSPEMGRKLTPAVGLFLAGAGYTSGAQDLFLSLCSFWAGSENHLKYLE